MAREWWIEGKGYDSEMTLARREKAANTKLLEVLQVFGLDHDMKLDGISEWTAWVSVLCPIHDDTKKSASLHLRKGWFVCHACGIGGDAVKLVRTHKHLNKREAIEWIENNT